jgi:endonuclease/exonuclease/phosphatase family metal-dependent hydrolase
MSYNIHHGRGVDDRLDLARIAAGIRNSGADIAGLQEVDRHWGERSDFADQAAELARALGMHVVYGANLDLDPLDPGGPRRQYGNAILSDAPIREWRNTLLPRTGDLEQRGLLEALVTVRGVPVRVFTTHLQHDSQQERIAQIAAVREVIGGSPQSVVLVGDLNARPGTPEIDAVTEDLVDAWAEVGVGNGYTFSTEDPHARLDYVLHSDDVTPRAAAVLSTDGSNHLPVIADLALPGRPAGWRHLGPLLRRLIRLLHHLQHRDSTRNPGDRRVRSAAVVLGRRSLLHAGRVVGRGGPAVHPGQPPPLQLGEPALRRGDDEEVGVPLPDVEAQGHAEQPRDAAAALRRHAGDHRLVARARRVRPGHDRSGSARWRARSMNADAAGRFSSQQGVIWLAGRMNPPSCAEAGRSSMVNDSASYSP